MMKISALIKLIFKTRRRFCDWVASDRGSELGSANSNWKWMNYYFPGFRKSLKVDTHLEGNEGRKYDENHKFVKCYRFWVPFDHDAIMITSISSNMQSQQSTKHRWSCIDLWRSHSRKQDWDSTIERDRTEKWTFSNRDPNRDIIRLNAKRNNSAGRGLEISVSHKHALLKPCDFFLSRLWKVWPDKTGGFQVRKND
jgi:hypothetical protein